MTVNNSPVTFDNRICALGESPFWHPLREELFWVDFPNHKVLSRKGDLIREWNFDEMITAIAWIDRQSLLLAAESGLYQFNIDTGKQVSLCPVEAESLDTRSNDGRADPWGGFWVSTMGKSAEKGKASIYRWYRGELRQLVVGLSIPNGICFDRSKNIAYYADSAPSHVFKVLLSPENGWPIADADLFLDLSAQASDPDGAVIDTQGCMWIALWDSSCVVQYSPEGKELSRFDVGTIRPTCPAFGGEDLKTLYVTTAAIGIEDSEVTNTVHGVTVKFSTNAQGLTEPKVIV